MDVKDLPSDTVLGERNNDGSKYASSATAPCNGNKLYQDMGPSPLGKMDVPPSRPCAVIGPDRVVPPPASNDTLKKGAYEAWCAENVYRHPPEYPHKMSNYQTPIRNISPRQTFQENMQRIMVPPNYSSLQGSEDPNFQEKNVPLAKHVKSNIPLETKYCEVPYNLTNNEQKISRNPECVPSVNSVLTRTATHGWPPHMRPPRSGALPAGYGAPELYQYPEFTNCAGPGPVPINRQHRMIQDEGHVYREHYAHDGNIRFKPYPTSKERYPQARYECIGNYPNPLQPPPSFPPQKYDLQKTIPSPYSYPQVPLKYLDGRIVDPSMDGYQRPNPQNNYNLPFRNQMLHPGYGPVLGNCIQNKYPCPPDSSLKPVAPNKLPYDTNKMYVDYENVRTRTIPVPEHFYYNDISRTHQSKGQVMSNYAPVNLQGVPSYPYYRKEHLPVKSYEFMPHYRNMDPSFMPISRIPSQFSPNSIAISPSDSNACNEATQIQSNFQDDCGYVSQSPTASIRSFDSTINRADFYRRYESRYGHSLRMSMMSKPEQNPNNNVNSSDKKGIDVRQFLQMWNEVDDENGENSNKDVTQLHANDINKPPKSQYEIHKNQDQLYVLGLVNVPNEELSKYEHIQKVSKLPENIKGYNNIELLKQFEEVIESSNANNFNVNLSMSRDVGYRPLKTSVTPQTSDLLQRPISPLDVEAKISQSVIHKEVGCNFEIKPCSPKMLNVEVATPVQTVLGERVIEKVTNPINMSPSILHLEEKNSFNNIKHKDHRKSSKNLEISSCKMINTPFTPNDLVRSNYSLQDLESNSGVCLASLPRLDNDIELNFPEVNQQFINANKGDSVLTETEDLSALTSENVLMKDNERSINTGSDMTYEFSPSMIESEREFSKLIKYRKKKIDLDVKEKDQTHTSSQNLRTDSVIIKNPENSKMNEANKVISLNHKSPDDIKKIASNLPDENNSSVKTKETNIEVSLPMDIAIDFSLKSDNSNFATESPLNKFFCDDTNQSKESNLNPSDDTKHTDNKTDSTQSQTVAGGNMEILKINNPNLHGNEEDVEKSIMQKEDVTNGCTEIPSSLRESLKMTGSSLTEISDDAPIDESTFNKNKNKMSDNLKNDNINPVNKSPVKEINHSYSSEIENKIDSVITPSSQISVPKSESLQFIPSPATSNELKSNNVQSAVTKYVSDDNLTITSSPKSVDINISNNSIPTHNSNDESDYFIEESVSDSNSKSLSTSTSDQEELEGEDLRRTTLQSSLEQQPNTGCNKTETEKNVICHTIVNSSLKRIKVVKKLNKELLSPRFQNLLMYSEGSTNLRHAKSSDYEGKQSLKCSDDIKIENTKSAISFGLNNSEELNSSFIGVTTDTNFQHHYLMEKPNEIKRNIDESSAVECVKSSEILQEKENTKSKHMENNDVDSCDINTQEENTGNNSDKDSQEENAEDICNNYNQEDENRLLSSNEDNCTEILSNKIIDDQANCEDMPHHTDLKQDTQDISNLKYMESISGVNNDPQPDILSCDRSKETKDDSYSNLNRGSDGNLFCKNAGDGIKSTEMSQDNIKQSTEDLENPINIEKGSENNCNNQKYLDVSCNIKQDGQYDKYSLTHDCIEFIGNTTKENNNNKKVDSQDLQDAEGAERIIESLCDMGIVALAEDQKDKYEHPNNNEKEDSLSNNIENIKENICSDDQIEKSLEIFDDITVDDHNLKDIESPVNCIADMSDDNAELDLKTAEVQNTDQKEYIEENNVSVEVEECINNNKKVNENLRIDLTMEENVKKGAQNLSSVTTSDICNLNNFELDNNKRVVEKVHSEPSALPDYDKKDISSKSFPNSSIITYQECSEQIGKDSEILSGTSTQSFAYVNPSNIQGSVKKHPHLKRSLSDSALDNLNTDSSDNIRLEWQAKRKRKYMRNFIPSHLIESNYCGIQNNRRKSVSAMYTDENVSFCILIDDNCIITEEDENNEEQGKICFTEISDDDLSEAQRSTYEHDTTDISTEILLCPQEDDKQYTDSENTEYVEEKSFEHGDINQYSEAETQEFLEEKSFEESWVEDIACVETVVSEDIGEDVISAHSSPKELYSSEQEDTELFLNSEHTDKVKYIYGDKMCNDDAQLLETLYRTPQMNVNKTLTSRESQMSDEFNQFYNKQSLEEILSESKSSCKDVNRKLDFHCSDTSSSMSHCAQIINREDDEESLQTKNDATIANKTLLSNDNTDEQKLECNRLDKTQDDTVHSCESSSDNVFSYNQKDDYTKKSISSSPEVSSTTSEDRNSNILLKITNYKGSRLSHINNVEHETKRISCKFTEVDDYSASLYNVKTPNRPLITKAAQKYIPPLKETIGDLKIRLPLPEHSLLKLKQLKLLKEEPRQNKYTPFSKKELPKKPKPKFEDVLKSIDEIQFQRHKENKKTKKSIPKVVIKKNENGSHYASTTKKHMFNPDLTGRKWQPWVFLEKNLFIDNMALKNKKIAVYNHRKNTFVLAENFRKYKSCSTKFVIAQPKIDNTSIGHLKCTIRLKHT